MTLPRRRLILLILAVLLVNEVNSSENEVECNPSSPVDVVITVDTTTANETVFAIQKQFLLRTIRNIDRTAGNRLVRYSVISFNRHPSTLLELASPFASDSNKVSKVISTLRAKQQAENSVARALGAAASQFSQYSTANARRVLLLAHDGINTDFVAQTLEATVLVGHLSVSLFAISGNPLSNSEALVGYTGSRNRVIAETTDASLFMEELSEVISGCPSPSLQLTGRRSKVYGVRARSAAEVKKSFNEEQSCDQEKVDLMIVLDTSGSVYSVFEDQRKIAIDMVSAFGNSQFAEKLQVSLVRFAATADVEIPFKLGSSRQEVIEAIKKVEFTGQNTRIAGAIQLAIDELQKSGRKDARQIFVLISDGHGQEYWNVVQTTGSRLQETKAELFAVSASQDYNEAELLIYVGHKTRLFIGQRYSGFIPILSSYIKKCIGTAPVSDFESVDEEKHLPITTKSTNIEQATTETPTGTDDLSKEDKSSEPSDSSTIQTTTKTKSLGSSPAHQPPSTEGPKDTKPHDGTTLDSMSFFAEEEDETEKETSTEPPTKSVPTTKATTVKPLVATTAKKPEIVRTGNDIVKFRTSLTTIPPSVFDDDELLPSSEETANSSAREQKQDVQEGSGKKDGVTDASGNGAIDRNEGKVVTQELTDQTPVTAAAKSEETIKKFRDSQAPALNCSVDLIMIVDRSQSVEEDFRHQLEAAIQAVQLFSLADFSTSTLRIGAVSFARDAHLELHLKSHEQSDVIETIHKIKHTGGSTSAVEGAKLALTRLLVNRRPSARLLILLFTDGHSQDYWRNLVETAMKLHDVPNSQLIAFTASSSFSQSELEVWAGKQGHVFLSEQRAQFLDTVRREARNCETTPKHDTEEEKNAEELIDLVKSEESRVRSEDNDEPTLVQESKIENEGNDTITQTVSISTVTVSVETTIPSVLATVAENTTESPTTTKSAVESIIDDLHESEENSTTTISATSAIALVDEPRAHGLKIADDLEKIQQDSKEAEVEKPTISRGCKIDLMFIVDISTSVEEEFAKQQQFAIDLVKRLPTTDFEDRVKVGVTVFNWKAKVAMQMGSIKSRSDILDALFSLENTGGSTSVASGVNAAVDEMERARRKDAKQMVVLVSDGNSQDLWTDVIRASNRLRTTGADVFAVTVSEKYMFRELELYAGDKWHVFIDDRIRQFLDDAEHSVVQCIAPATEKSKAKEVVETENSACNTDVVDFLIMVDTTTEANEFTKQKDFIISLLKTLPAKEFKTRISTSIVTLAKEPNVVTQLGSAPSPDDIIYELERLKSTPGQADLQKTVNETVKEITARKRNASRLVLLIVSDDHQSEEFDAESVKTATIDLRATGAEIYGLAVSAALGTLATDEKHIYAREKLDSFIREVGNMIVSCPGMARQLAPSVRQSVSDDPVIPISHAETIDPNPQLKLKDSGSGNSVQQESIGRECQYNKMDLQIILDASASREEVFDKQRELALSLIEKLPISADGAHVAVGVNSFTSVPVLRQTLALGRDKKMVRSAIKDIAYHGGSTLTAQAVELSIQDLERGRRPDAIQVVVLMNDGISQDNWDKVLAASQKLEATGAERFGVALGEMVDFRELHHYIGNAKRIYRDNGVDRFISDVLDLLKVDKNCDESGQHRSNELVPLRDVPNQVNCEKPNLDILVLFDNSDKSENMTDPTVNSNRYLLLDVLGSLVNYTHVRVSVLSFTEVPKVVLNFTNIAKRDEIFRRIENIFPVSGVSSYSDAINVGLDMLQVDRRDDARAALLLVGDGMNSDSIIQREQVAKRIKQTSDLSCLAVDSSTRTKTDVLSSFTGNPDSVYDYQKNSVFAKKIIEIANERRDPRCPLRPDEIRDSRRAHAVSIHEPEKEQKDNEEGEWVYSTVGPIRVSRPNSSGGSSLGFQEDLQLDLAGEPIIKSETSFNREKVIVEKTPEKAATTTESLTSSTTKSRGFNTRQTTERPTLPTIPTEPIERSDNGHPTTVATTSVANSLEVIGNDFTTTARRQSFRSTTTRSSSPKPTPTPTQPSFVSFFSTRATASIEEASTTFAPGCLLDVIFVLDSSGSVEETFRREKELASGIIDKFRIGPNNARVAIIKFASRNKVKTVYSFNQPQSRNQIFRALRTVPFSSGTTAIDAAIVQAIKEYSSEKGARVGQATPLAIILTDGFGERSSAEEAQRLREIIPNTFAIAINHVYPISRPELERITGDPARVFTDRTIGDFNEALKKFTKDCVVDH